MGQRCSCIIIDIVYGEMNQNINQGNLREEIFSQAVAAFPLDQTTDDTSHFYLRFHNGSEYLIKFKTVNHYENIQKTFHVMKFLDQMTGCVPEPVLYGLDQSSHRAYLMTRWVHGETLSSLFNSKDRLERHYYYISGAHLGLALRKIHSMTTLGKRSQADTRKLHSVLSGHHSPIISFQYKKDISVCIRQYMFAKISNCIKVDLASFVEQGLDTMPDQSLCLLHGNLQTQNILRTSFDGIKLTDLDSWEYGDPYLEIARVILDFRLRSKDFLTGLIDVYYSNEQSGRSFMLLSLYIASELMKRLILASSDQSSYQQTVHLAKTILNDYDNFKRPLPRWYKSLPFDELKWMEAFPPCSVKARENIS